MRRISTKALYDYVSHVHDYETLQNLGDAINAARLGLFKATDRLSQAEGRARTAKVAYERNWRRFYLGSKEKTEASKRAYADILSEEYEDNYIVYDQLSKDIYRSVNALRIELQTLQTIGNNIRQQMKME